MARKRSSRKKRTRRKATTRSARKSVLLKDATAEQLERELQKRREQEVTRLEKERAELDSRISALKSKRGAASSNGQIAKTRGGYTPRPGSHGDHVIAALAEGGEWTLDDLAGVTGAGKPTLSAAVLPKLIDEGLVKKSGRGKYVAVQ